MTKKAVTIFNDNARRYTPKQNSVSVVEKLVQRIPFDENHPAILDIGIANGKQWIKAPKSWNITGIDGSPEMLKSIFNNPAIRSAHILDLAKTKSAWPDISVHNIVISQHTLKFLPNATRVIEKMLQLTRTDGIAYFDIWKSTANKVQTIGRLPSKKHPDAPIYIHPESSIIAALNNCGGRILNITTSAERRTEGLENAEYSTFTVRKIEL